MTENSSYTIREFAKKMHRSKEYVRQCCSGQKDSKSGRQLHLPEGWRSKKIGRQWCIFRVPVGDVGDPPADAPTGQDNIDTRMIDALMPEWIQQILDDPEQDDTWSELLKVAIDDLISELLKLWRIAAHKYYEDAYDYSIYGPFGQWKDVIAGRTREEKREDEQYPRQWRTKKARPVLQGGYKLLHAIALCYQYSVIVEKKVKVQIEFHPDGKSVIDVVTPTDQPLLFDGVCCNHRFSSLIRYWAHEVREMRTSGGQRVAPKSSDKFCHHCGKDLSRRRVETLYCSTSCKTGHRRWIKSLCSASENGQIKKIMGRLRGFPR